ncbi:two pore domain potassium channel family protein [Sediminibacillus dalangtanensis]|uniref:Two pore domain potassium channel family protein n=1 Tax=Sediminibacillus dalangtanensis TaxID=2729421 RepID=A0ABX7VS40_9BACI|nr:potassium channel family protein [Sediminibacillus dalangtanensis]QTM98390.1 two pore domain potassium channel family protein [Sediminibacillus dalangtanensis]
MLSQVILALIIIFIVGNLYYFFTNKSFKKSYFNRSLFFKLFFVLTGITFGFALLYYVLSLNGPVLVYSDPAGSKPADHSFLTYLYYSGETILSVGYGDIVPLGVARPLSLIEAAIGVLLPTAYFMRAFGSNKHEDDNDD